jgi:hypothetical protein
VDLIRTQYICMYKYICIYIHTYIYLKTGFVSLPLSVVFVRVMWHAVTPVELSRILLHLPVLSLSHSHSHSHSHTHTHMGFLSRDVCVHTSRSWYNCRTHTHIYTHTRTHTHTHTNTHEQKLVPLAVVWWLVFSASKILVSQSGTL